VSWVGSWLGSEAGKGNLALGWIPLFLAVSDTDQRSTANPYPAYSDELATWFLAFSAALQIFRQPSVRLNPKIPCTCAITLSTSVRMLGGTSTENWASIFLILISSGASFTGLVFAMKFSRSSWPQVKSVKLLFIWTRNRSNSRTICSAASGRTVTGSLNSFIGYRYQQNLETFQMR